MPSLLNPLKAQVLISPKVSRNIEQIVIDCMYFRFIKFSENAFVEYANEAK